MHQAILSKQGNIIKELLQNGADVNATAFDLQETPLHTAVRQNYKPAVAELIRHGADPEARNTEGQTVRQLARSLGRVRLIGASRELF